MKLSKNYKLIINSQLEKLETVEEFLIKAFTENGISEEVFSEIFLALNEAVSNAIVHGNKSDINKKVEIDLALKDGLATIKVKDEGKGFDPEKIPDPTKPENILKESGRGIFIMKNTVKKVKYDFSEKGTTVILQFNIQ